MIKSLEKKTPNNNINISKYGFAITTFMKNSFKRNI